MSAEEKKSIVDALGELSEILNKAQEENKNYLDQILEETPYDTKLAVTAWVMRHILDHAMDGGSYRYLIYDRLGFDMDAYGVLQEAGALTISNEFDIQKMVDIKDHVREEKIESMKKLVGLCDEPECYEEAGCGFPSDDGYRWTCYEHSKFAT
jgi:hypothetical protein